MQKCFEIGSWLSWLIWKKIIIFAAVKTGSYSQFLIISPIKFYLQIQFKANYTSKILKMFYNKSLKIVMDTGKSFLEALIFATN